MPLSGEELSISGWVLRDGRTQVSIKSQTQASVLRPSSWLRLKARARHVLPCSQHPFLHLLSKTKDLLNFLAQQTKILMGCIFSSLIKLASLSYFFFLFFFSFTFSLSLYLFIFLGVEHHSNCCFSNFQVSESQTMLSSCVCNSCRSKVQLA